MARMNSPNNIKKWIKILVGFMIHPLFLAFVVAGVIIIFLPYEFPKYEAKITRQAKFAEYSSMDLWDDLNNDGYSDNIKVGNYFIGQGAFAVYLHPSLHVEEWKLHGNFDFNREEFVFITDFDDNKMKEIFVLTLSNDSVFLHGITDFYNKELTLAKRFITKVGVHDGERDIEILHAKADDLNGDGFKELIFGITCGFSEHPRRVFAYDIRRDSLLVSPPSGFQLFTIFQDDIVGSHEKEIILGGYAPRNILDSVVTYHDSSCWLMVLDKNLQFLFPPIEFPGRTGALYPIQLSEDTNKSELVVFWGTPFASSLKRQFLSVDSTGKIRYKKEIVEESSRYGLLPFQYQSGNNPLIAIPSYDGVCYLYDTLFAPAGQVELGVVVEFIRQLDLDQDQKLEYVILSLAENKMGIFREGFEDPVYLDLTVGDLRKNHLSLKNIPGSTPALIFESDEMQYFIKYAHNPMYHMRWLVYAGIYLFVLLFALLIRRITQLQLQKRYDTEKKVTELQLKIVRNQMDPHFTFNAINSVMDSVNKAEKEKANAHLLAFSKMYRSMILSADKIRRTLKEEIEFTESYLALEQFRFQDRFAFQISVDPLVNIDWEVPKMVIQSPVENAVKHGLFHKSSGGVLKINIFSKDNSLVLEIEDNGVGRGKAGELGSSSTGKGLKIMDQFYDLYHQLTGIRVISSINDLFDEAGNPTGTKVIVTIPLK